MEEFKPRFGEFGIGVGLAHGIEILTQGRKTPDAAEIDEE